MSSTVSHTVTLEPSGDTFAVAPGQRLLDAAREAGFWLPFECGWGSCGTCKATLVSGEIESLFPEAPAVSERDARRGRILLCQSAALSDVSIRPLRVETAPLDGRWTRSYVGVVTSVLQVGPGIVDIRIETPAPVTFRPGQFAIITGPRGVRRCYSLAGAPDTSALRFVLKQFGEMSAWLASLAPGSRVAIEAPYGDMWIRPSGRDLLLIAGGTGISAILGLATEAAASHADRRVTAIYGARTPSDLVLLDELREVAHAHGNAVVLALADSVGDGAAGIREGRVTSVLDQVDLASCDVYLAGPPAMVDAVESEVANRGVQRDRLFVDRFG